MDRAWTQRDIGLALSYDFLRGEVMNELMRHYSRSPRLMEGK